MIIFMRAVVLFCFIGFIVIALHRYHANKQYFILTPFPAWLSWYLAANCVFFALDRLLEVL